MTVGFNSIFILKCLQAHFTNYRVDAFSSWNDSLHFCRWAGVICSDSQHNVIGLNLTSMDLYGNLSPFIGNLSFLESIDLSHNFLNGIVPPDLGRLTQLKNLNLSFNSLSQAIPATLSRCSNLINISLEHNFLGHRIPSELSTLSLLERLYLQNNNFTGSFPVSFGNLSSLQEINLSFNELLGEVPDTVGNLVKLTYLHLGSNQFSGIFPPAIYNLSKLTLLSLAFNDFNGELRQDIAVIFPHIQYFWFAVNSFTGHIPMSLPNASSLIEIDLSENQFTGNVPLTLGNLRHLAYLHVRDNSLGHHVDTDLLFLNSLPNCSKLESLEFGMNNFGGTLPSSIANLSSSLVRLSLYSNSISGTIPDDIASLTGLTILYLGDNLFTGNIPASIGTLPNMQELDFYENSLTGLIPPSLGNLSHLLELYMYKTSLHGSLPSSFANLTVLQVARFAHNKLNGTIPPQFIGLASLIFLNLSHNSFTGPLPVEVGNLEFVTTLDVSHNNLSGDIPMNLGLCISLNTLRMQSNSFQGNLPDLSQLRGLEYLDLSINNLTGHIPMYFANFSSLVNFNLSFNDFEGEVPRAGIFLNATAIHVNGNSKLCGGIPQLSLHPCPARRQRRHVNLKIIIPTTVISFIVLLSLFMLFLYRKNLSSGKASSKFSFSYLNTMITFKELYDSTDGFSSNNLIGSGSFGTVYIAKFGDGEVPMAVKVLNLQRRGASRSFAAECEALRNIRHRNLVRILSVCSSVDYQGNDFKALIYPFMSNGSLENWLHAGEEEISAERELGLTQRIHIAIDIASALAYLHHQCHNPVVHCDLKPSNILLDYDLTARVSDFGLANILSKLNGEADLNPQFSSLGIMGTIGYTAPEYGMGNPVSTQGDVYSYGILLLELFTGRRPVDQTFDVNINLHDFVRKELLDLVLEIIRQTTPVEEKLTRACRSESKMDVIIDCVASVLTTGVVCSSENPQDRINMEEVVHRLVSVKEKYLRVLDGRLNTEVTGQ